MSERELKDSMLFIPIRLTGVGYWQSEESVWLDKGSKFGNETLLIPISFRTPISAKLEQMTLKSIIEQPML